MSIFLKSRAVVFIILEIFFATAARDLPVCHMSITSKIVSWLPKSTRLSIFRFRFSRKHVFEEKVQHLD